MMAITMLAYLDRSLLLRSSSCFSAPFPLRSAPAVSLYNQGTGDCPRLVGCSICDVRDRETELVKECRFGNGELFGGRYKCNPTAAQPQLALMDSPRETFPRVAFSAFRPKPREWVLGSNLNRIWSIIHCITHVQTSSSDIAIEFINNKTPYTIQY